MLPDVLTVAQMAELLDCTQETVEDKTRERTLPGLKFGRSWVYPREAVLEVLRQQALAHVRPPAAPPTPSSTTPRVVPMLPKPAQRQRGRSPAPLPDPPACQ